MCRRAPDPCGGGSVPFPASPPCARTPFPRRPCAASPGEGGNPGRRGRPSRPSRRGSPRTPRRAPPLPGQPLRARARRGAAAGRAPRPAAQDPWGPPRSTRPSMSKRLGGLVPRRGRGRVEPPQRPGLARAPQDALQHEARQVGTENFGIGLRQQLFRFSPETHADARPQAARPAPPLVRRRLAGALGHEPVQARGSVEPRKPRPPRVRDRADAGHR